MRTHRIGAPEAIKLFYLLLMTMRGLDSFVFGPYFRDPDRGEELRPYRKQLRVCRAAFFTRRGGPGQIVRTVQSSGARLLVFGGD